MHVNNISLDGGLPKLLNGLCPEVPIFVVYDDESEGVGQTAEQMRQFIADGQITPFAKKIAELCALPEGVDIFSREAQEHFASINLIGYSYGASLIQQASQILAKDIWGRFEQSNSKDPIGATLSLLRNVSAVNIGPNTKLYEMDVNGAFKPLESICELSEDTPLIFNQAFFVNSVDKIVEMAVSDYYETDNSRHVFYNRASDCFLKKVGFERLKSGSLFPKIKYEYDFEGHHLGLYTNVLSFESGVATYPSSSNSDLLRQVIKDMVSTKDFDRTRLEAMHASQCVSRQANFLKHQQAFQEFISEFQNNNYEAGLQLTREMISQFNPQTVIGCSLKND